jgi:long-chain fatty acid transport protein
MNRYKAVILACCSTSMPTFAEGFRSPTIGTYGLGLTGGRFAFVEDASAAVHNPANLVDLQSWEASAEPTIVHYEANYQAANGTTARTEDPWKVLPHLFVGGKLNDRVALGLAVTVPYGLSIKWEPNGAFRYSAPNYTSLQTINLNPNIAVKLTPKLSLAAGFDAMWSQLEFRQFYPWSVVAGVPGLPDGQVIGKGDGVGWSGNAALTWEFLPDQRLALTVRAPMDVDYGGSFTATGVPTIPGGVSRVDLQTQIKFPTIVGVGYGLRLNDNVRLSADLEWLQFSRFQSLILQVPASLPGLATTIPQNWRDTFTLGGGLDWKLDSNWTARASYQFFQTPVPSYTFSPLIPDSNQNVASVGLEWHSGHHRLAGAYAYVSYADRNITSNQNPAYVGRYEISVHLISLNYGYTF